MAVRVDSAPQIPATIEEFQQCSNEQFATLGFHDAGKVRRFLSEFLSRAGEHPSLQQQFREVMRAVAASPDPDQAFQGLNRWLEAPAPQNAGLCESAELLRLLCILFAATPALSEYFIRFPGRTQAVLAPVLANAVSGGTAWRAYIAEQLRTAEAYTERLARLRRARIECMLQITVLDLTVKSPLQDTVRALSDLADACVESALEIAIERLRPRIGVPDSGKKLPFVIFALGKLGGHELNYSSDIDLIFMHNGEGETSGGTRTVDAQNYFTALGEEIVSILDKVTDDGRVYRVDLRLRPHGSAGPLVRNFADTLNYYQTEGRTWERQAWLKGRSIAGDQELGNSLIEKLEPFTFRRYLSLEAIHDIQALKRQIELSVAKRGETADEVKLGRGGIRDIEFTVQFMQLLYGAEHPQIRTGNSQRALLELRREGLLSDSESEALTKAYVFLRNVEHRLQLHGDLQVHKLPSDAAARKRIALSLGYSDSAAFENDRQRHTSRTRAVFEKLFANLFTETHGAEAELSELLLAPEPDLKRISDVLPALGFSNSESSARELLDLSRERLVLSSPSRTRKVFAAIAPKLLKALAATGDPEEALRRFSRIAGSLGAKAMFYQMLNENSWLLRMTAELAAWSEFLTSILVANPGLFDELVDALQIKQRKTAREMRDALATIAGSGDISDTLRAFKAGELLRIGVADLIHSAGLDQTQAELSDLAEAILSIQLQHTLKQHEQRLGKLKSASGEPIQFTVLALGKFGGQEMNYGSDLDVIFFYSEDGATESGMPAVTYYSELCQALMRALAAPTALGTLYELDARLRPNGNKGPLALSLDDFKRYWQSGQLADWERLALTRARIAAGDEKLGERALHLIRSSVFSPLQNTHALGAQVRDMRRRLEESAGRDDLKRGAGGLVDIEFIAQYLQLLHGPALPPLRQANTERALQAAMKFKKLEESDGNELLESYRFLRSIENRVRVVHGLSSHELPRKPEALRKLALRAGYTDSELLMADFRRHTVRTREIFEKTIK